MRQQPTEELDEPGNVTMQNRQHAEILRECLTQLSPANREVISVAEVAEIIGVPQNTVKTRMFYARKQIAELMAAQGIDRASV